MCGIAGVMGRDGRPADRSILERMARAMFHRGPDGTGLHIDGAVGLLNTRLAIVDVAGGDQPFLTADGSALVANGEIYNDPALREQLTDVTFQSHSDCEPPLHLYHRQGLDFPDSLRGMYAIALHDKPANRLILARDPYGIKQLYYTITPDLFAFASEPQALISAGLVGIDLESDAGAELMQLQFTTGATTIYRNIFRLLPGETLVIDNGAITERRRIQLHRGPAVRSEGNDSDAGALANLDRLLTETVKLHVRADVPSGLFLSGGIDSSVILTLMSRLSSQPVTTLTAGFNEAGAKDESEKARRVAKATGADHHMVTVTAADFFAYAPKVAQAMDDPTTDSSALPIYMLAQAAHTAGLKVILSGEGADEMFGGYKRYRRALWFFGLMPQRTRTRGVFSHLTPQPASLARWRDGLARTELAESANACTAMQRLQDIDCAEWLPNDLLIKLDRCLMANSVEGRTPFLDPVLSPFAYGLPNHLKVRNGLGKWLLREWLSQNLPEADAMSKKQGFIPPMGQWIEQYRSRIEPHLLVNPGLAELSLLPAVRQVFSDLQRYPQAAWNLIFYALWHSHHVLGLPAEGGIEEALSATRLAA